MPDNVATVSDSIAPAKSATKDTPIADDCQSQFAPGHTASECDHCKAAAKAAAKG